MPTRSKKPPKPRAGNARARRAPARPTRAATQPAESDAPSPVAPRRAPPVERTCYEVRLMVCPRNPATCPDVRPVDPRVFCGSPEMLVRFEKAGGAEDDAPEAGFSGVLPGFTITGQPGADPDERDEDTEGGDE